MLRNYLLIAWRNLLRHKTFSLINIFGLAFGMAACILILLYVSFEWSYDDFHDKVGRIYRVRVDLEIDGKTTVTIPKNAAAAGPALKKDLPEVEDFVRIFPIDGTIAMKRNNVVFNEKGIYFADPSFLTIFSYPLLKGDAATALREAYTVVLTQSAARKFFGKADPVGKIIQMREGAIDVPLTVKGILKDVPENSHLAFDYLVSHATLVALWGTERADRDWSSCLFYTYVLLKPSAKIGSLQAKFPAFIAKYANWGPHAKMIFQTQALRDIYLHSDLVQEAKVNGNGRQVYFLLLIAGCIMLIAWTNYSNLATARSLERAREVGIRKVSGASRWQIVNQFVLESVMYNLLAIGAAFTLVQLLLPLFIQLTGKPVQLWHDPQLLGTLLLFFASGTLASAFYPGFLLSGFQPASVLKGKLGASTSGARLRKGFTVFQFAASIALMIGTFTVYAQLQFMRTQDLGMNIGQTLVLINPDVVDSTFEAKMRFFREELRKHKDVRYVTTSTSVPGKPDNIIQGGLQRAESTSPTGINHYGFRVDHDFIDAFGLRLLAGRNFSRKMSTDGDGIIINRTAMKAIGFRTPTEAIGQKVETNWTHPKTILGVVEDFHQQSLKTAYDPVAFVLDESGAWGYYSVKFQPGANLHEAIPAVKRVWEKAFPDNPFTYFFLDDYFNAQYQTDQRFGHFFQLFAGLTIFIACLGLLGLSLFTTTQRTKEIGVRKVLGASVASILLLLSKDFLKLVLLANLFAWPLAFWGIDTWLKNYAFRIPVSPWLFILPGLLVGAIALLTISFQTLKSARANPVKALRTE